MFLRSIICNFQLEQTIYELRYQLESLEWNRKEIEETLRKAIKEYRVMESELDDLEDEHDEAISRIEKLEAEVQKKKNRFIGLVA